jgi:predicted flap endonuclease-1-like 5' DNA nuclease
MDEFGHEVPHGIGRVAKRELAANGYTRYDQLTTATAKELLRIHGIGKRRSASCARSW